MFFSHGTNQTCGTLVLIKNDLEFELNSFSIDSEGRHVLLDSTIQSSDFLLVNIYAPNDVTEQCRFFRNLNQLIENNYSNVEQKIAVGGDFNVTFDQDLDCSGGKPTKKNSITCIEELRLNFDLVDIWRIRNPDCRRFTWRQKSPFMQRRLDYWLISNNYQEEVVKADIVPSINSDHSARINPLLITRRSKYDLFHILFVIKTPLRGRKDPLKFASLPTCGFVAQLEERPTSIREARVQAPSKPEFFFRLLFLQFL